MKIPVTPTIQVPEVRGPAQPGADPMAEAER